MKVHCICYFSCSLCFSLYLIYRPECLLHLAACRGVVFETLGRYDEAKRDYEAVLAANPTDAAAWNNLGNVNAASLDWKEAFTCYDKAVELVN